MKRDGNGSVGYRSSTLTSKKIKLFPCLSVSLCVYLCLCLSVSVCLSLSLIFYCLICWVYAHMCNSYVCMTLWTHYVFVLIFSFLFLFCFLILHVFSSASCSSSSSSPPYYYKRLPVDDCRPTCLGHNEHMDKPLMLSFVEILSSPTFFRGCGLLSPMNSFVLGFYRPVNRTGWTNTV